MKKRVIVILILTVILISGCMQKFNGLPPVDHREELIYRMNNTKEFARLERVEYHIPPGDSERVFIGIRNTANETRCFKADIICLRALEEPFCLPESKNWLQIPNEINIAGKSIDVFESKIEIPVETVLDTYLMQYDIYQSKSGDCSNPALDYSLYQSKQFFLYVK